jgi:hypothetical protein
MKSAGAEERIEDAGQAASERDDGDMLAPTGRNGQRPQAEGFRLRRPAPEHGDPA